MNRCLIDSRHQEWNFDCGFCIVYRPKIIDLVTKTGNIIQDILSGQETTKKYLSCRCKEVVINNKLEYIKFNLVWVCFNTTAYAKFYTSLCFFPNIPVITVHLVIIMINCLSFQNCVAITNCFISTNFALHNEGCNCSEIFHADMCEIKKDAGFHSPRL